MYKGFDYYLIKANKWRVTYPSGWKTIIQAESEDALKVLIDEVIALFDNNNNGV